MWCRDDDAFERARALDKLVSISESAGVPRSGFAVIPVLASESLATWLREHDTVSVLVHGFVHVSHALSGEKRAEFGAHRPLENMLGELSLGWARFAELFRDRCLPLFVPPWNRFSDALLDKPATTGLVGVSTYQSRGSATPVHGIRQTNGRVDILEWKTPRGFVGETHALRLLIEQLAARRLYKVDAAEATGILTHHKDHDEDLFDLPRGPADVYRQTSSRRLVRCIGGGVVEVTHRYPTADLIGDYARSAFGFTLTLAPMTQLPPSSVAFMILLPLSLLFVWLGWTTFRRQRTRVICDGEGVRLEPAGAAVVWRGLESIDLSYFSTRADRRHGWMQLTLSSGHKKVQMDSRLTEFSTIVGQANTAALKRGLSFDAATRSNLEAMGLAGGTEQSGFAQDARG